MATFGELWAAILPSALPGGSSLPEALDRELAWVRVLKARVPAFDALDPGDVVIVPGSALAVVAPGPMEVGELVDALAAARCAGILLIDGDRVDPVAGGLVDASLAAGLPLLRVGHVDAGQLERSVIGFLVNRRAELEHQAGLLEATLEEVALGSGDVAALIAAIAGFLGRAVALEGRRGEVVAVHAPEAAAGAAAAVSAYLAGSRIASLRVPLPAPPAGAAGAEQPVPTVREASATPRTESVAAASAGRLVFLGDRPPSELERIAGPRVGRLLALELARADAVRRAHDTSRRAEVLPSDGPPWVVLVARQVAPGSPTGASAAGTSVAAAESMEAREEIRSRLRVIAPARKLALRGDASSLELRLVLAVGEDGPAARSRPGRPSGDSPDSHEMRPGDPGGEPASGPSRTVGPAAMILAARVADLLDRPVAVSRPFDHGAGRPAAEAEARATLEAAESMADPPRVARADRLPAYRLLASLRNLGDGTRNARALLEPLLTGSPDARRERLATLRAVLEQPGFNEAAAALGVHRNTLAYRIRRIEAMTGWRLADSDLRLPLAIAVNLVQSDQ